MNDFQIGVRRRRAWPALITLLACVGSGIAFWAGGSRVLAAALPHPRAASTIAFENTWARVQLPKPTYTPIPPPATPTLTAMPSPTSSLLIAEIVADTPTAPAPELSELRTGEGEIPSSATGGAQYVLVDISQQHLYAYEDGTLLYDFVASTGMNNATATGTFSVLSKIPNAYGATWNIWMPNWLGIYWAGGLQNGIHALPILSSGARLWAGFLGTPISYGCVVLGQYESQLLYDWARIGTPVEIQW